MRAHNNSRRIDVCRIYVFGCSMYLYINTLYINRCAPSAGSHTLVSHNVGQMLFYLYFLYIHAYCVWVYRFLSSDFGWLRRMTHKKKNENKNWKKETGPRGEKEIICHHSPERKTRILFFTQSFFPLRFICFFNFIKLFPFRYRVAIYN